VLTAVRKETPQESFRRRETLVHRATTSAVALDDMHDHRRVTAAGLHASLLLTRGEVVAGPVPLSDAIRGAGSGRGVGAVAAAAPPFNLTSQLKLHPARGTRVPGAR